MKETVGKRWKESRGWKRDKEKKQVREKKKLVRKMVRERREKEGGGRVRGKKK